MFLIISIIPSPCPNCSHQFLKALGAEPRLTEQMQVVSRFGDPESILFDVLVKQNLPVEAGGRSQRKNKGTF